MAFKEVRFNIDLGGGGTVKEAIVTIYRITNSKPEKIESCVVGEPVLNARLPVSDSGFFYAVAEIRRFAQDGNDFEVGSRTVQWISVFTNTSATVALSERVTTATAYCFARFLHIDNDKNPVLSDPHRALHIAEAMKNNFVATDGTLSAVIQQSPNGLETNSYAMFNFLSNLLYYSLTTPDVYSQFTDLTHTETLLEALLCLPHDPFVAVEAIYALISQREQLYAPSLPSLKPPATPVPKQWTLTIKVNDSGAENFMIAGVGYVVFDKNDRAWLTNNVRQGTPNSSTFCVVLEPDGSPAPFSPLFGGGLLGPGFGVATDPDGEKIYFGNFGWGPTEWNPETGSISVFSHEGEVLSTSNGYTEDLSRVQGLACDPSGNLWMSSWGTQDPMPPTPSRYNFEGENSALVVYLDGDPQRALIYPFDSPYHLTFDVAFDAEGNGYVSNSGYGGDTSRDLPAVASSVYKFRIENGELCALASWVSDKGNETLRQITVAPSGEVYVVGVKSSRVIKLDQDLNYLGELTTEIYGPWGITFDPQGTMFVANFAREMAFEAPVSKDIGPFGVTVVRDGDEKTANLMTLPTGGDEVTLANGLPLYGNPDIETGQEIPLHSHDPLMRLTATQIDRAGNLWACNNWKPSAAIDVIRGNPGGDGIVIFVGVAEPAG